MRTVSVAMLISLAIPSLADARGPLLLPPGNSAVSQYIEPLPTAAGNQTTASIHRTDGATPGGDGGGGAGTGGSARTFTVGTPGGDRSAITRSTDAALARRGQDGIAAARLARATLPSDAQGTSSNSRAAGAASSSSSVDVGSSAAGSLLRALTGSAEGGGLGVVLPLVLAASAIAAGATALQRRRRAG